LEPVRFSVSFIPAIENLQHLIGKVARPLKLRASTIRKHALVIFFLPRHGPKSMLSATEATSTGQTAQNKDQQSSGSRCEIFERLKILCVKQLPTSAFPDPSRAEAVLAWRRNKLPLSRSARSKTDTASCQFLGLPPTVQRLQHSR
jgi:hypothetical protein